MSRLLFDDLLTLGRKTALAAITRALEQNSGQRPWPLAVDATAGNGNDTAFLAEAVKEGGQVLAFDVQDEAIAHTRLRLEKARLAGRVRLIRASHGLARSFVEPGQKIAAAMFNLGFLPGSASALTTAPASTLSALGQIADLAMLGGALSVHCYLGQPGGDAEAAAVSAWMEELPWADWRVARYEFCNKNNNKEILFLAQRMR